MFQAAGLSNPVLVAPNYQFPHSTGPRLGQEGTGRKGQCLAQGWQEVAILVHADARICVGDTAAFCPQPPILNVRVPLKPLDTGETQSEYKPREGMLPALPTAHVLLSLALPSGTSCDIDLLVTNWREEPTNNVLMHTGPCAES